MKDAHAQILSKGRRMKMLRRVFILCLFCSAWPSPSVAQEREASPSQNYQNCLYGRYGCDSTRLTAEEKEAVAKSAHHRNYQNCLYGRHGCDSTQLTAEEKEAVAKSARQRAASQTQSPQQSGLSNNNHYTNSDGQQVHSPAYSNTVPSGATAQCRDGSYSFSQHRQGTCSHHGGVARWL